MSVEHYLAVWIWAEEMLVRLSDDDRFGPYAILTLNGDVLLRSGLSAEDARSLIGSQDGDLSSVLRLLSAADEWARKVAQACAE